jgi:ankyrin repeat protein
MIRDYFSLFFFFRWTPLHLSAAISYGENNELYVAGQKSGYIIVSKNSTSPTEILVKQFCSLSLKTNEGLTPLMVACMSSPKSAQGPSYLENIQCLLTHGANPNDADSHGWTCLI